MRENFFLDSEPRQYVRVFWLGWFQTEELDAFCFSEIWFFAYLIFFFAFFISNETTEAANETDGAATKRPKAATKGRRAKGGDKQLLAVMNNRWRRRTTVATTKSVVRTREIEVATFVRQMQ